jgi:hypothetical protein
VTDELLGRSVKELCATVRSAGSRLILVIRSVRPAPPKQSFPLRALIGPDQVENRRVLVR